MANGITSASRVAVVGGGPAGSFFALYLLAFSRSRGFAPEVDIYEPKDFTQAGPRGCNRCAGILSASLLENLKELGLEPPPAVVRGRIQTYTLHSPFGTIEIDNPSPDREILSVYRGSGPLLSPLPGEVSFDSFLLREATKAGAYHAPLRVEAITLNPSPAVKVAGEWRGYDLVVLATGVNSPMLSLAGVDYRPPPLRRMAQDELAASPEDIARAFGQRVKVFLLPHTDLLFGTLVPKGSFINVSLLGIKSLPSVGEFLNHPLVKKELPFPYLKVCGCHSLISIGRAKHPIGPGFIAIGDAGVTRLYKDGIGAALLTARQAAHTVAHYGTSQEALSHHYLSFLHFLHQDNRIGQAIFYAHHRLKDFSAFFHAHGILAAEERGKEGFRPFSRIFWGLFTGSYSYRRIMAIALKPQVALRLGAEAVRQKLKGAHFPPSQVLILGGGFGGVYTALSLEKKLRKQPVEITLVSQENFLLFTPLLHEVATGGVETRHIAQPIRSLQRKRRFSFLQAQVEAVDLGKKLVHTSQGSLPYDFLVLALGAIPDTSHLPGTAPYLLFLKTLYDGMVLRNRIISLFEEAAVRREGEPGQLTFVIVGGGATGVQLIAELRDFVSRHLLRAYPTIPRPLVRFLLVQDEDRLLEDMDPRIASYALSCLRGKGIEVRLRSRVTQLFPQGVELNGEEIVPTATVLWTAGIRANPVVESLPLDKDALGRVKVNRYLEVAGYPGVYALGDNACFLDPRSGQPLPPRAHIAVRQPQTVAQNILADLSGGKKQAFRPPWMGELVSLGSYRAAAKVLPFRLYGLPARIVWLVGYLVIVPSRYLRTRIALDWLLALLFGRDLTLLRLPQLGVSEKDRP